MGSQELGFEEAHFQVPRSTESDTFIHELFRHLPFGKTHPACRRSHSANRWTWKQNPTKHFKSFIFIGAYKNKPFQVFLVPQIQRSHRANLKKTGCVFLKEKFLWAHGWARLLDEVFEPEKWEISDRRVHGWTDLEWWSLDLENRTHWTWPIKRWKAIESQRIRTFIFQAPRKHCGDEFGSTFQTVVIGAKDLKIASSLIAALSNGNDVIYL